MTVQAAHALVESVLMASISTRVTVIREKQGKIVNQVSRVKSVHFQVFRVSVRYAAKGSLGRSAPFETPYMVGLKNKEELTTEQWSQP